MLTPNDYSAYPDAHGRFGDFGGLYVAETLMPPVLQLAEAYEAAKADPAFQAELDGFLTHYVGRPSPLYFAERLTDHFGGAKIYLKREELNHTGSHKINNCMGQILLARNAAWPGKMYALITGFMEAGESPQEGVTREIAEETNLQVSALQLVGVYDFQRMNQVIIAYHAVADGEIKLSPELAEYKLYKPEDVICWPAGTGFAVGDWLRTQGIEPRFMTWDEREKLNLD